MARVDPIWRKFIIFSVFAALLIGTWNVHTIYWDLDTEDRDIYYSWLEGKRILSGENPYERILSGDMRDNRKYSTYFPLFYLVSSATQLAGFDTYPEWIAFWRPLFLLACIGVGCLLFVLFYRRGHVAVALFACSFWWFNRWSLYISQVANQDFIPLLILLVSVLIFARRPWLSLLLFGLSLALKQVAIFLFPLYLIWAWQTWEKCDARTLVRAAAVALAIPFLASLPFLIWNAEGFIRSVLFSATRGAEGSRTVDTILNLEGLWARLPMASLMAVVYLAALGGSLRRFTSVLLVWFVFLDFNTVWFAQYMCWVVPFIALGLLDYLDHARKRESGTSTCGDRGSDSRRRWSWGALGPVRSGST